METEMTPGESNHGNSEQLRGEMKKGGEKNVWN